MRTSIKCQHSSTATGRERRRARIASLRRECIRTSDRYSYVHGNPINMIDPSGEIAWQIWAGAGVAAHGGDLKKAGNALKGQIDQFTGGVKKFLKGAASHLQKNPWVTGMKGWGKLARTAGANLYATADGLHLTNNETMVNNYRLAQSVGMSLEDFGKLYITGSFLGTGPGGTWFGHIFTGDGNLDPFAKFYSNKVLFISRMILANELLDLNLSTEKILAFALMIPGLSPSPLNYADKLSRGHDRSVPGTQFRGSKWKHMQADADYIEGYFRGYFTGEIFMDTPENVFENIVIGAGGSVLLTFDYGVNIFR